MLFAMKSFMVPRGWMLNTLMIPWPFISIVTFGFMGNVSTSVFYEMPWNLRFMFPSGWTCKHSRVRNSDLSVQTNCVSSTKWCNSLRERQKQRVSVCCTHSPGAANTVHSYLQEFFSLCFVLLAWNDFDSIRVTVKSVLFIIIQCIVHILEKKLCR